MRKSNLKPEKKKMSNGKKLNKPLHQAKAAKNDEFYTQLSDIENELKHYRRHLKGKTILCNCDDPYESNFFKYFADNFNALSIKKLITTSYSGSPITGKQLSLLDAEGRRKDPYVTEINAVPDMDGDGATGPRDVRLLLEHEANVTRPLKEHGDFRSQECIELLKQADIVITNPPFSLFKEYVAQIMKYKKKFLIIGNKSAISYKETFALIKNNEFFVGNRPMAGGMWFIVPDGDNYDKIVDGQRLKNVPTCWFTNMDIPKRHEKIILCKLYNPKVYPTYDNYDAIEVERVAEIPMDYFGNMGVPITFLDKYNPKQFEIVGSDYDIKQGLLPRLIKKEWPGKIDRGYVSGQRKFARILIKRRTK